MCYELQRGYLTLKSLKCLHTLYCSQSLFTVCVISCVCVCLFVQGERGPEGPVEEVCGGGTDAEERGEPGQ